MQFHVKLSGHHQQGRQRFATGTQRAHPGRHGLFEITGAGVVAVAYGVVRRDAPIIVEWAVILVISLVLLLAIYDLLVRRTAVTRFLFGMRPATRPAVRRTTSSERTGPPR